VTALKLTFLNKQPGPSISKLSTAVFTSFHKKLQFLTLANFQHHSEVVLDACHMIKLVRNSQADLEILKNSKGLEIKWDFIKRLHDLQREEGLHAANMLRKGHIEVHKQKMKSCWPLKFLAKVLQMHFISVEQS
jgi:hypothetical protein